jgi:TRAP-type C4-dicarboxylate transport system permease large subunit
MFLIALPTLILPIIIRTAVVEGVATATEVSTVGVVYTIIVGPLVYRRFKWRALYPILVETAALSGAILLIIGTATSMGWALAQSGFATQLVSAMSGLPGGKFTFLVLSILLFAVLGSLLEGIPAIVLFGPLLFPVAKAVGVNEVHYAMVAILSIPLHGARSVLAPLRSGLLHLLRNREGCTGTCCHAGVPISRRAPAGPHPDRGGAVDLDRVPQGAIARVH